MLLGILVVVSLYLGINVYIGFHILSAFSFHALPFWCVFGCLVIISLFSFSKSKLKQLSWIGMSYFGLFVYFWLCFMVRDVIGIVYKSVALDRVIVLFVLILGVYGIVHSRKIVIKKYTLDFSLSQPYRIGLISDVHIGAVGSEKNLERIVSKVNECDADLVLIAGDLFNNSYDSIDHPEKIVRDLGSVQSKKGVYFCLGNHDGGKDFEKMMELAERGGIRRLDDEFVDFDDFCLCGRVDASPIGGFGFIKRKELDFSNRNKPIIVMDHNPGCVEEYKDRKIDLLLCGHSHAGQIFPFSLVTKKFFYNHYGYTKANKDYPSMIVSSGASTWGMPMRIGSNSEVVLIEIK